MDITEETVSRDDMRDVLALYGLRTETQTRCSALFLFELYIRTRVQVIPGDPAKIIAEVQALEGYGSLSQTKEPTRFNRPPLRGLWHKHYLAQNSLVQNVVLELGGDLSSPSLPRLANHLKKLQRPGATHFTAEDVPRIADAVVGTYWQRAARRRLTGEWIIFAKHGDQNYYLCLGEHADNDHDQCGRILSVCAIEFPFLNALLLPGDSGSSGSP